MSLALPTSPALFEYEPRIFRSGSELSPATGGPDQRLDRMGDRYALDVTMPPMTYETSRAWSDLDDWLETCTLRIPQPGLTIGSPGTPLINGADQTGRSLILNGLTPGYILRKHQWISILTDGRHYCYRARADATADGSGNLTALLRTMLRVPHADNDPVEIAQPVIEGFVTVAEGAWKIDARDRLIRLRFLIKEVE